MQLAAEMVGQATVVVVNAQIGRTDLTHAQFLLLVRRCRHSVAILLLGRCLFLANIFHLHTWYEKLFIKKKPDNKLSMNDIQH